MTSPVVGAHNDVVPNTFPDDFYVRLGLRLRERRKNAGLTQQDLANALQLSRTSITNMEGGRQPLLVHTLVAAASAVGVAPSELIPEVETEAAARQDHVDHIADPAEQQWVERVLSRTPST